MTKRGKARAQRGYAARKASMRRLRDRVLLGMVAGCGLNASQAIKARWEDLRDSPDGWTLLGSRVPQWLMRDLLAWKREFMADERILGIGYVMAWYVVERETGVNLRRLQRVGQESQYAAGVPIEDISRKLGHKDIKRTLKWLAKQP